MIRHFYCTGQPMINRSHGLAARMIGAWMQSPQSQGMNIVPDLLGHHPGEATGGASTYPSQYGVVPAFDGTDDVISMGAPADWNGATKGTLVCAIYRSATSVTCGMGGSNGVAAGTSGSRFSFLWFTDGRLYGSINTGGSAAYGYAALNTSGWIHAALVYDGSQSTNATKEVMYVNGIAQSLTFSGTVPTSFATNPLNPFTWGKDSSNRFTGGSVHHSFLFDAILSAAEIQALYQEWLSGFPTLIQHPQQWAARIAVAAAEKGPLIGGRLTRSRLIEGRLVA